MKKSELKQAFKTIDLALLLTLMGLTCALVAALISFRMGDPQKHRAYARAQSLALQLASGGLGNLTKDEIGVLRKPAASQGSLYNYKTSLRIFGNQGRIGTDPWNNAYRYMIIEKSEKRQVIVVVWSDGPNGQRDTTQERIQTYTDNHWHPFNLQGDDVGYVFKIADTDQNS